MPRRTTVRILFGMAVVAASLSLAGTALAAPAQPAGTGSFKTWSAAQKAAGFKLVKPGSTDGLIRAGRISVTKCEVTGELSKRLVDANYGNPSKKFLDIQQNNSGGPCGNIGVAKDLGHYTVDGVRAYLIGECGLPELPHSCHSRDIWLYLSWTKNHVFYQASSHDQWRATIVSFARSLIPAT
jgi:hypothetical protein